MKSVYAAAGAVAYRRWRQGWKRAAVLNVGLTFGMVAMVILLQHAVVSSGSATPQRSAGYIVASGVGVVACMLLAAAPWSLPLTVSAADLYFAGRVGEFLRLLVIGRILVLSLRWALLAVWAVTLVGVVQIDGLAAVQDVLPAFLVCLVAGCCLEALRWTLFLACHPSTHASRVTTAVAMGAAVTWCTVLVALRPRSSGTVGAVAADVVAGRFPMAPVVCTAGLVALGGWICVLARHDRSYADALFTKIAVFSSRSDRSTAVRNDRRYSSLSLPALPLRHEALYYRRLASARRSWRETLVSPSLGILFVGVVLAHYGAAFVFVALLYGGLTFCSQVGGMGAGRDIDMHLFRSAPPAVPAYIVCVVLCSLVETIFSMLASVTVLVLHAKEARGAWDVLVGAVLWILMMLILSVGVSSRAENPDGRIRALMICGAALGLGLITVGEHLGHGRAGLYGLTTVAIVLWSSREARRSLQPR